MIGNMSPTIEENIVIANIIVTPGIGTSFIKKANSTKMATSTHHKFFKGRHPKKKNCRFGENGTIGGEGVRKIIEFSSFTNDEKHGRGGSQSNISLLHRTQL